jgi:hypothetical protein
MIPWEAPQELAALLAGFVEHGVAQAVAPAG